MNRLIYDIEIKNAIPGRKRIPGINYCRGWFDYAGMGVAVIGYKWNQESPAHCRDAASFFDLLLELDDEDYKLVGFNSNSFDDKLLAAHDLEGITTHYDVLEEVRIAAGFGASFKSVPRGYSYKLDVIAKANGFSKTGDGSLAPILWQQGKHSQVIEYCKNDVEITSKILDLGLAGELIDPNTGKKLQLAGFGGKPLLVSA